MTTALKGAGDGNDTLVRYGQFVRSLVQKVVIAPSPDNRRADLTIHGRLAVASRDYSARMRGHYHRNCSTRVEAGEFSDVKEKAYYLSGFQAILEREADWKQFQVSAVAGARLQPASTLGCHWPLSPPPIRTSRSSFSICSSQTAFTSSTRCAVCSPSQTSASLLISKYFEYRASTSPPRDALHCQ